MNTEDMKTPLCHSCCTEYGIDKITRLEKQLEMCKGQRNRVLHDLYGNGELVAIESDNCDKELEEL